jgi:hypothetical protein
LPRFAFISATLLPLPAQVLPPSVTADFDLKKAQIESTRTRERISLNGLWRWQPAASPANPPDTWGFLRVPEPWPSTTTPRTPNRFFYPHPSWARAANLRTLTAAWYQRDLQIPASWTGRRITLTADLLNSYAAVFLDGRPIGEMRYPFGELDLTPHLRPGTTHVLALRVEALPLKAVMLSFRDTAAARTVEGTVQRKGLCGDVWLNSTPAGPRIASVSTHTSVRKWQITFNATVSNLDPTAIYTLRARIPGVRPFTHTFRGGEVANNHITFTAPWHPDKLWDTISPQNQYTLTLDLLSANRTLDTTLPTRVGFREFWIDGRDFYLNGTRIYLSALPIDNAQESPLNAGYDAARATLQRFKSFGINFVYTHNYGCEPGAHLGFDELLRAADDEGVLLSFSQPPFSHYDWTAPDADSTNGYVQHAAYYVGLAQNHPSVVFYSMSHNATGYSEDMNPDLIDGIHDARDQWGNRNKLRAERAEAIVHKLDPYRIIYHHASGNLGPMHVSNFYGNWIPVQEMSDWFEHWSKTGVKPLFTCEYSVPFMWDWAMYRGWYKGKREFGSAVVPWELNIAEWDAQFLGDIAYQHVNDREKAVLRWEAAKIREGKGWLRWDAPESLNSQAFDDRYQVIATYLQDNWRAFRTLGVSANSPWDYGGYWKQSNQRTRDRTDLPLDIDWDHLQRPGPRAPYVNETEARKLLAFNPSDYQPTAAAEALYRNNMPLLGYIAGKAHNFLPGETIEKQLIVINNSRREIAYDVEWSFNGKTGRSKGTLATGRQNRTPLKLIAPASGQHQLKAVFHFPEAKQEDTSTVDVVPPPAPVSARVALFDPKGETAKLLDRLHVAYQFVTRTPEPTAFDLLVIGKHALTLDNPAPELAPVRQGMKVIVFEQTGQVLEQRLGFRIAEYELRQVFPRVPDHPILHSVTSGNLHDWRGEATTLPPRLTYEKTPQFNLVPTVKWAGIPVTRVWRNGSRGSVASALIEKPAKGNFLPIVDGGYSLQYSPLLEHREGKGLVIFCQLDVTGRTESDPAAQMLARNIIEYVTNARPQTPREVFYEGSKEGRAYLESLNIPLAAQRTPDQLLVTSVVNYPLAIGNPVTPLPATEPREHISTWFPPFPINSPFAGISPADTHNRDPRTIPLITEAAALIGDGVLAQSRNTVFSQLVPWQFQYAPEKMNVKRTFRKVAFLTMRLLGNQGVAPSTPLLSHITSPPKPGEQRWLTSFYLDTPEEWDDPYRFFRW